MIRLVVFDMAGTTIDEDNVVYKTVRRVINQAGYCFTQEQVQAHGAGKEKSQAIRDVLALDGANHTDEEVAELFEAFKIELASAYQNLDVKEQPGAAGIFGLLRQNGIKVVLNTGYDRKTAEGLIQKIGWKVGVDVDGLVTASDVANSRPAPDMIQMAMEICDIADPRQVAKIGDSKIDIEEGKNANCGMTFGITTGAQTADQLLASSPTAVFNDLNELADCLLRQG